MCCSNPEFNKDELERTLEIYKLWRDSDICNVKDNIKFYKEKKGFSRGFLECIGLDINKENLYQCRGKTKVPFTTFLKICMVLKVDPSILILEQNNVERRNNNIEKRFWTDDRMLEFLNDCENKDLQEVAKIWRISLRTCSMYVKEFKEKLKK